VFFVFFFFFFFFGFLAFGMMIYSMEKELKLLDRNFLNFLTLQNKILQHLEKEDEETLSHFMSKDAPVRKTLADVIMDKIKEKETEIMTLASGKPSFLFYSPYPFPFPLLFLKPSGTFF